MGEPDTAALKLLSLVAVSGDFPAACLSRVLGPGRYKEHVLTSLRRRNLVRTYQKDGLRSYRLTKTGKLVLLSTSHARFASLLETPRANKSEAARRVRAHQVAETYVSMLNAGVKLFPDQHPDLFAPRAADLPPPSGEAWFYAPREAKRDVEATKIKHARFTGLLVAPTGTRLVYNTGRSPYRWEYKAEQRAKALTVTMLRGLGPWWPSHPDQVQGLMLGASVETGYQLLASDGGAKRAYFRVDRSFSGLPFLTMDRRGDLLLRLLCSAELTAQLRGLLLEGTLPAPGYLIENDGLDARGNPVLLAYDFDLQRITNFRAGLYLHDKAGTAICFDYQAEVLHKYFGSRVELQTVSFDKLEKGMF